MSTKLLPKLLSIFVSGCAICYTDQVFAKEQGVSQTQSSSGTPPTIYRAPIGAPPVNIYPYPTRPYLQDQFGEGAGRRKDDKNDPLPASADEDDTKQQKKPVMRYNDKQDSNPGRFIRGFEKIPGTNQYRKID